ncbi:MAG TPA: cyanophycin synthetase, partial [Fimbriimonas sp.]
EIEYAVENGVVRVCTPLDEVRVQPSLHGEIQAHNVALAFAAMQRSLPTEPQALAQGALHAYVPGRFEEVEVEGVKLVLDGAHNSEAARVLAETLAADRLEGLVAIVGMTDGHDPLGFIRAIAPRLRTIHAVPIDYHRSQRPEAIAAAAGELGVACRVHETVPEALRAAQASGGPILVTGSFYLVGEVLRHLKLR